jgi:catalase
MIQTKEADNIVAISGPPWFDKKCGLYKSTYLRALHTLRNTKSLEENSYYRQDFLKARSSYNNLLAAKKKKFLHELDQKLSNVINSTEFYRSLSYFRPRRLDTSYTEAVNVDRLRTH